MGLINRLSAEGELDADVDEIAKTIANNARYTIKGTKKILRLIEEGAPDDNPEAIELFKDAYDGDDFKEGTKAFREKRKPDFK